MFFFPYKADLGHDQIPFITILVALLCLAVYFGQAKNEEKFFEAGAEFCTQPAKPLVRLVMDKTFGSASPQSCFENLISIHLAEDRSAFIKEAVAKGKLLKGYEKQKGQAISVAVIEGYFEEFQQASPGYDTRQLWYAPQSWNPLTMITAAFAHGSWDHVIFNLFFFFAFAAAVEMIIGSAYFLAVLIGLSVGTHLLYSLFLINATDPRPTVGLSGVVMGVMTLFAFFLPRGKIRCFFWIIFFFRRFSIPAWLLVIWFLGWNVFDFLNDDGTSHVNFQVHLTGGLLGYVFGWLLFRTQRQRVTELAALEPSY